MIKKIIPSYLSVFFLLFCLPSLRFGHVHLEKSNPAKGEILNTAPDNVELWFSGKVSDEWSKIEVTDAKGNRVDNKQVRRGTEGAKHLSIGLQSLSVGTYNIRWNVVAGDGHRVKGSASFTIK